MSQIHAQLEWRNAQPYSSQYGDVYFSTDDGWAETEYVFLQHNQLEQRWQKLEAARLRLLKLVLVQALIFYAPGGFGKSTLQKRHDYILLALKNFP